MTVMTPVRPAPSRTPAVPRTGLVRLRVSADDAQRRELSNRELQVLTMVAAGGTKHEISRQLGIAPRTVASHMSRIYRALGARNAAHAVALAYGCGAIKARREPPAPMVSRREREVLAGLAHGLTSAQVAWCLSLSSETVKTHLQRIYRKLEVTCRANAVDAAIRRRLLAVVVDFRTETDERAGVPQGPGTVVRVPKAATAGAGAGAVASLPQAARAADRKALPAAPAGQARRAA